MQLEQCNSGAPFELITIDIADPLPVSNNVVMDYITKWPEVYDLSNLETRTVVNTFVNNCVCRFKYFSIRAEIVNL